MYNLETATLIFFGLCINPPIYVKLTIELIYLSNPFNEKFISLK